jgi:transcriptional regulator with XRE-family HTH domain
MGQPMPPQGDSTIIVSLSEAAMHMYAAAIDALPFAEDKKFHKRADVVLSGMRKLRAALAEAARSSRPSPAVIVALSGVRRRYDALMTQAAEAPGSSVGQQLYVARINAKLSAEEVANGAGLSADLLDELEAGGTPSEDDAGKVHAALAALGGVTGTEQQENFAPEHEEPAESHEEHHEQHVNGWDESLVGDNPG